MDDSIDNLLDPQAIAANIQAGQPLTTFERFYAASVLLGQVRVESVPVSRRPLVLVDHDDDDL
jgi:hypothetical protein